MAVCIWFITPVMYGDMIPLSRLSCNYQYPSQNLRSEEPLFHNDLSDQFVFSGVINMDYGSVGFIPESNAGIEQASKIRHLQITMPGSGSRSLCLYTLIGLGLCSSVTWAKRISFGFIPQWYHEGGPHQVGHSYAVMPGTLRSVPICSFVQQVDIGESLLSRYYMGIGISLLRNSHFTQDMLSYRGPPHSIKKIFLTR